MFKYSLILTNREQPRMLNDCGQGPHTCTVARLPFAALAAYSVTLRASSSLRRETSSLTYAAPEDDIMWTPVPLPFLQPPHKLPAPLPTTSQIRKSEDIINQRTDQTIVTIGPDFVGKYGLSTPEREGQTLLYLEHSLPRVPAPRLHATYYDGDDLFIVMERIRGSTLAVV